MVRRLYSLKEGSDLYARRFYYYLYDFNDNHHSKHKKITAICRKDSG